MVGCALDDSKRNIQTGARPEAGSFRSGTERRTNMDEMYLHPFSGGRWVISRRVDGRWITLVQNSSLFDAGDAESVLRALNIEVTQANLDTYFPLRKGRGRSPTLALLELCNVLDPTNPVFKKQKGEAGV